MNIVEIVSGAIGGGLVGTALMGAAWLYNAGQEAGVEEEQLTTLVETVARIEERIAHLDTRITQLAGDVNYLKGRFAETDMP